jgi:hypothetical protein
MENNNITMTAWTPSFGMPVTGHTCARASVLAAADLAVVAPAAKGRVAVIAGVQRALPGRSAWRPPSS